MPIETIPISGILKTILKHLPSFILKKYYTPSKLENLIYCDLYPRGGNAEINLGDIASSRIILQIINLSPFIIELDRLTAKFTLHGGVIDFTHLKRTKIEPGEITNVYLEASLSDSAANSISRLFNNDSHGDIYGNIEFNCPVINFSKRINTLSNVYPKAINLNFRNKEKI